MNNEMQLYDVMTPRYTHNSDVINTFLTGFP